MGVHTEKITGGALSRLSDSVMNIVLSMYFPVLYKFEEILVIRIQMLQSMP